MIDLGLTASDRGEFEAALRGSHRMRVQVAILDRNESVVGGADVVVVQGAVQVDTGADVARQLQMQVLDPEGDLQFVPASASDAGVYADQFVAVERGIYVDALSRWVDVPVFWGPLTRVEREGDLVTLQALGKETLGLQPAVAWKPIQVGRRTRVHAGIRRILEARGEARFDLATPTPRIRGPVTAGPQSEPWKVACRLASGADRQLFYDGRGRARLRRYPDQPVYRFRTGEDGDVIRQRVAYDVSRVRNVVEVVGEVRQGQGDHKRVRVVRRAAPAHPLSPESLARNGKPRFLVERIEQGTVGRQARLTAIAKRTLKDLLRAEVDAEFDALPAPHLEEGDLVALDTDGRTFDVRLQRFTIPLTSDAPMTVGYLQRVALRKAG